MADWADISDLWWLQPSREDVAGHALQGLAIGAQTRQHRMEADWHREQAQTLIDQRRAALATQQAKTQGVAKISSYLTDVAQRNAWTDPAARAGLFNLHAQYPQSLEPNELNSIDKMFTDAVASKQKAADALKTTTMKELDEASSAERKANALEQMGPLTPDQQAEVGELRTRAQILREKQTPPGETVRTFDPNTGQVISEIYRGSGKPPAQPGELTVASRTKRQQDLMAYGDVAETLNYVRHNMNASDFGVRGRFKDLYAKIAGQLGFEIPQGTVSVRAAITTLRAALVKSLRSDSNITDEERKTLEESIPSISNLLESLPTAADKLNEATRNIFSRSRRAAEELKLEWKPAWLLTPDQLWQDYKKGRYGPQGPAAEDKLWTDLKAYHTGP